MNRKEENKEKSDSHSNRDRHPKDGQIEKINRLEKRERNSRIERKKQQKKRLRNSRKEQQT